MESIYQKIKINLEKLDIKNKSILVALSGGMDSMTLLNILLKLKDDYNIKISAGYINHNLRGEESVNEEKFIREYLQNISLPFYIHIIDKSYWETLKGESTEMAARKIRYSFFNEISDKNNIDFVATAHNLNDRIETYFLQLFRAGGVDTLKSIPMKNKNIIRPLINISRDEIEKYVYNENIDFIEDSSNKKNIFKRNIIRNKLLPIFREVHPNYEKSFVHVFNFMQEEQTLINQISLKYYNKIKVFESNYNVALKAKRYKKLPVIIQKNIIKLILKKMKLLSILNLSLLTELSGNKEKYIYKKSDFHAISKLHMIWFINKSNNELIKENIIIDKIPFSFNNDRIEINMKKEKSADPKDNFTIKYDKSLFPVKIRLMNKNDVISISDDNKASHSMREKTIKKILDNNDIPKIVHNQTLIIESSDKKIIGFINNHIFRVSTEYYINDQSDEKLIFIFKFE